MRAPRGFPGPFAAALVALALASPTSGAETASASTPRILVGPNILVSRDGDVPHVELMVAASPKTTMNLLGGAITFTRPDGGMACRAYASTDGGMTWKATEFSEQIERGGGDPQVAYTAQGTPLFIGLAFVRDEKGVDHAALHVYRSGDGGRTWDKPSDLGYSYDHEQVVVDPTKGRFAGRIYIGVLYGHYPEYTVGVFRSDDDGRTFVGPVQAASGGGKIGINDVTPVVLSDGTLILPYADFEFRPEKRKSKGRVDCQTYWTVSSSDGGVTFSEPRKVAPQQCNFDDKEASLSGFGKFAADSESKRYPDRVYFIREDSRLGPHRILFSWSADRGKTWSPAKAIDGAVADPVNQFQPAIAVNKDGVVGVTWFDTRDSADGKRYHEYFSASLDGGATFLPPVRVSSAPSNPKGRGNRQMMPMIGANKDVFVLSLMSAAGWSSGGHYMGLAADKDGDFHAFWVDARSGTSQIYAARVKVDAPAKPEPGAPPGAAPASPVPAPKPPAPVRVETVLTGKVEMIFDPTSFDADKSEFSVPVRFKNVSSDAIYPPIRMELVGFGYDDEQWKGEQEFWKDKPVALVNASNGKPGVGAVVELSEAVAGGGADGGLLPGAQTNPVVLRLHLSNPDFAPSMRWKATGSVAKAQ